jgi:hypothetical protein
MVNWNEPDERWEALGYETRDAYQSAFVIPERWHANVPEDVITSYETVEHLMAYAYSHYPMYDDSFKRLLTIMEMAVKLKAEQEGISLTFEDRNGRTRDKNMERLINDVSQTENTRAIPEALNFFRDIRNILLHPGRYTLMGGMSRHKALTLVNHINLLFLNEERRVANHSNLVEQLRSFRSGCFVLERNGNRYLVCNFQLWESAIVEIPKFLIYCEPVLTNTFENVSNGQITNPFVFEVQYLRIEDEVVRVIETDDDVSCTITTSETNINMQQQYYDDISHLSPVNRNAMQHIQQNYLYKAIEEFRFRYWWS